MLKKENSGGGSSDGGGDNGGNNNWARVCDTCRAAACTVYCKADSAYLCVSCDARIHAANRVASRHERVWVCEACERAPATFLCKADAASLCTACDSSIHSANPLARRHQRVPILPISGDLNGPRVAGETNEDLFPMEDGEEEVEEEDETASWLLLNPVKKNNNNNVNIQNNNNNGFLFAGEVDEYLDLVEYNSNSCPENQYTDNQQYNNYAHKSYGDESVVPVQSEEAGKDQIHHQYHNFQLGLDLESSKSAYTYNGTVNHGVPVSSMDVGMVPDPTMRLVPDSTMGEVSLSHPRPPKGTIDLFSSPSIQMPSLLSPRDREARVLRYREKKKTRKFEKTIRYASRKAYAETRPRIKGRFAKRADAEVEVDQMFSTSLMAETGYGIVPGF